jgi:photosystem II stability/assembly factor-like uncharacterized protein
LATCTSVQVAPAEAVGPSTPQWEQSGWGGGGFYWAAAFHPTQNGVIYMGGDVAGVYKTIDHGRNWRMINKGLANYGVYSLAVDRMSPQTVYAATEGGLCKSTDGGEQWQLLPRTGRRELRITGERNRSYRSIAVDPTNGNIVYAGSPAGKIYKSIDGGQNWAVVYDTQSEQQTPAESGGKSEPGSVLSVAVAPQKPSTILAITQNHGLVLTQDAGKSWKPIQTPARASAAAFDPSNSRVIYAGIVGQGIGKSTDGGLTWTTASEGLAKNASLRELVVSPTNSQDVYAIAANSWTGYFYASHDGGKSWKNSSSLKTDPEGNPTLPAESPTGSLPLSTPTNLAINPLDPKELFISANWRSCWSQDAGQTWFERDRGADISVITDVRFSNGRTFVSAMDEGTLVSENNGRQWRQLWPLKWTPELSGHNWRLAITPQNGGDRIIATASPWEAQYPPRVIISEDGGKSFKVTSAGLPDYVIRPNTMWGVGHPRALAVDPQNPQIVYLGIDGDPSDGKSGGGIFKSQDGGTTWKQLPQQPGSRRMFYGLAVDPTNSQRVFWAASGTNGGLWRSEDGGDSWERVFSNEEWAFNVMVTQDGTVYCPGKNLWRSTDHGKTWQKLTNFSGEGTILGLEADPRDAKTLWISVTTWDNSATGGVYKTVDEGKTWQEITGNLPFVKPQILRFNPATQELWAAGVGLYKLKQ